MPWAPIERGAKKPPVTLFFLARKEKKTEKIDYEHIIVLILCQ